ncbi:uncharacterized protein LOC110887836 [Helianthus annuus]|uniref:uncharacterized protein LOC110887836 n=1 Tax=Helianthus annuus TaxID=4232 RepID=UPI000B8F2AA5|nr:uncharacterized protein LOC110887836 [Helianthus annuus]
MRRASNKIPGLKSNGSWITKPNKIKSEVMRFFRERFSDGYRVRPNLLCENTKEFKQEEKELLTMPFLMAEIKDAVNDCGDDKAPDPDGFNVKFIKKFWYLFDKDFKDIMDEFFDCGKISVGGGHSFITLVSKIKDPVELNNYSAINLIGIISKVVSKVLANRLKKVIGSMISEVQSAFIKDN